MVKKFSCTMTCTHGTESALTFKGPINPMSCVPGHWVGGGGEVLYIGTTYSGKLEHRS